jgi:GTP-binding protein EngB required for normal cell division
MTDELKEFREQKQSLISRYDLLLANSEARERLFPSRSSAQQSAEVVDELTARRTKFEAERFVVAVAGVVNVGKSTLLNALLVGRNLLSMAPVPMTATITEIVHGDDDAIAVTFYSTEEWTRLNKSYEGTRDEDDWHALLDSARKAGCTDSDVIGRPAVTHRLNWLSELVRYTAVPSEGGTHSPYVATIRVMTTLRWGTEVDWVDTPGTLDPNPIRANKTRTWIQRADAVIYITDATQAGVSESDLEFMTNYLAHIPSAQRIVVVNKVDAVTNRAEILDQFDRIKRRGQDEPDVQFLAASRGPVLCSAEAALTYQNHESGEAINSIKMERYKRQQLWGWAESGMAPLEAELANVLVRTKGADLLTGEIAYFSHVVSAAEKHWRTQVAMADEAISATTMSTAALQHELERARRIPRQLEQERVQIKEQIAKATITLQDEGVLNRLFKQRLIEWANQAHSRSNADTSPQRWRNLVTLHFAETMDTHFPDLLQEIFDELDRTAGELNASLLQLEASLSKDSELGVRQRYVTIERDEVRDRVKAATRELKLSLASQLRPNLINFFQDSWFVFAGKNRVQQLKIEMTQKLRNEADLILAELCARFSGSVNDIANEVQGDLTKRCLARIEMLDAQLEELTGAKEGRISELRTTREHAANQREAVRRLAESWATN